MGSEAGSRVVLVFEVAKQSAGNSRITMSDLSGPIALLSAAQCTPSAFARRTACVSVAMSV